MKPSARPFPGALVGRWVGAVKSGAAVMEVAFEVKTDGTFSESIREPAMSFSGTYRFDAAEGKLTVTVEETTNAGIVPVGTTMNQDVSIGPDGNTFTASGSGSSGEFRRQRDRSPDR